MITSSQTWTGYRVGAIAIPLALLFAGVAVVAMPRPIVGPCPAEGDCFEPHDNPGCQDEQCCDVVCDLSPSCCTVTWDAECVAIANEICPQVPTEGACCVPEIVCVITTEASCAEIGGEWLGGGTECNEETCPGLGPNGACCVDADVQCVEVPEAACATLGGVWLGEGTQCIGADVCTPKGACCIIDECQLLTEAECTVIEGAVYKGDFTECVEGICDETVPGGACCLTGQYEGLCVDQIPQAACLLLGSLLWIEGASCADDVCPITGRCCIDDVCVETTDILCAAAGGVNFQALKTCYDTYCDQAIGACCLNDECSVESAYDCELWGGVFLGNETTCDDVVCEPLPPPCPTDLTDDGMTDGADLGLLLGQWGECPGCSADLDGNDAVDGADLGLLLGGWGPCPE